MRDAFISELTRLAREDDRVFLIVGDLGFSVIEEFAAEFPERFLNAGVAEQSMIGVASGLAASGYTVFVYSIGNFPTMRAIEQIRNDVCYHDRAVTIVSVGGGFSYGSLGYTHHAIEDLAVMRALPRMTVLSPADPLEARALTRHAVAHPGPHYLRLGKNGEAVLHDAHFDDVPPAAVLREGTDVTILVTGSVASVALDAADLLSREGVSARVVSVPMVKPMYPAVLDSASGTRGIVTLEEHSLVGGFGSAVLELVADQRSGIVVRRVGVGEENLGASLGSQAYMREQNGLTAEAVADAARSLPR